MVEVYFVHVYLFFFVRQTLINGQFDWTVQQRVSKYGDNLTLICVVEGCCTKPAGWGRWIPEFSTIFIDVKGLVVSPKSKYDAMVYGRSFTLVIRFLNESDLNIPYACTYGYNISTKKILSEEFVFKDKTDEEQNKMREGSKRTTKYLLTFILTALCVCVLVGIVLILLKACKFEDYQVRNNTRKGMMNKNIEKANDYSLVNPKCSLSRKKHKVGGNVPKEKFAQPDETEHLNPREINCLDNGLDASNREEKTGLDEVPDDVFTVEKIVTRPIRNERHVPLSRKSSCASINFQRNERNVPLSRKSSCASININYHDYSSTRDSSISSHKFGSKCSIFLKDFGDLEVHFGTGDSSSLNQSNIRETFV